MAEQTRAIQQMEPQPVQARGESTADREREGLTFRPSVDIIETKDEYVVVADLPGAEQDSIDITYQEEVLVIRAPVAPRGQDAVAVLRQEYGVGSFHRRFVVEAPVDADRMTAEYEHGVLRVHLPKAEQARGRRIEVTPN